APSMEKTVGGWWRPRVGVRQRVWVCQSTTPPAMTSERVMVRETGAGAPQVVRGARVLSRWAPRWDVRSAPANLLVKVTSCMHYFWPTFLLGSSAGLMYVIPHGPTPWAWRIVSSFVHGKWGVFGCITEKLPADNACPFAGSNVSPIPT